MSELDQLAQEYRNARAEVAQCDIDRDDAEARFKSACDACGRADDRVKAARRALLEAASTTK